MVNIFPKRILLCGGGVRTIAQVGVLIELEKIGYLKYVTEWAGVSAGGFLAMCLSLGYTLIEIREICMKFNFMSIVDIDSAPGWILNMGLDSGNMIHGLIIACLRVKGMNPATTFKECILAGGKSLRLFVTDLKSGQMKVFSETTTPDFSIVDAVRASMTIPFYFQPFEDHINNTILIDGAILSNYPMIYLSETERRETIGILLRDTESSLCDNISELDFKSLLIRPIELLMITRSEYERQNNTQNTIVVDISGVKVLDFDIDTENRLLLIQYGRDAVSKFIKSFPKPVRRYSCS